MDGEADREFARLAGEYLDDRAERHPELATSLGDHRFDDRLADRVRGRPGRRAARPGRLGRPAGGLDLAALSAEHRVDAAMMADSVARRVFELDELAEHTWNPLLANPGRAIYQLLARDFAPLPERLASVAGRLAAVPARTGRGPAAAGRHAQGAPGDRHRAVRRHDRAGRQGGRRRARGRAAGAPRGWPRCARPPWRPWPSTGPGCPRACPRRRRDRTATGTRGSGPSGSPASSRSP